MDPATIAAALLAGALIGLVLGLVGGGGSILAVPLLVYFVGVGSPAPRSARNSARRPTAQPCWHCSAH